MPVKAYVARPHRLRVVATILSVALAGLSVFGWYALPDDVRALFSVSQVLTLLGVLGLLVGTAGALAASSVRADGQGLRIRNGLRVHRVPWARVHKILLRPGDAWGLVLLTPADGTPFRADIDADKRHLMGIQRGDGDRAVAAVQELRARLQQARAGR